MQFTGANLELVHEALGLAIDEVHNMIATCPDVRMYASEIAAYEQKQERLLALKNRVAEKLPEQ